MEFLIRQEFTLNELLLNWIHQEIKSNNILRITIP